MLHHPAVRQPDELTTPSSINPDAGEAGHLAQERREHACGPLPILHAGRLPGQTKEQSQGIDDKMAFASRTLPASAETAPPFSVVFPDWLSRITALG